MKTVENITKRGPVVWAEYEVKLDQLDILFKFVLHAFLNLSETKRKEFVKALKLEKEFAIAERVEMLRKLSASGGIFKEAFDETTIKEYHKNQNKKARASFRAKSHTQYLEWVMDGMISAEILFRVTMFEDFLKHVHAAALSANTKIFASARPSRQIACEQVFSVSFNQFKEQQICREVEELDRQSMEQRLDYFAKHLGIDFDKKRKWIIEISDIRNKIAHGNPLQAITKEDTSLPLDGIQGAIAKIIRDVMHFSFEIGKSAYPQTFRRK
jgi:hypothetical protein